MRTGRDQSPWWKIPGLASLVAFWGVLAALSLFILWQPDRPERVLLSTAPVGYRFTFEEMRLHDHGEDSTTLIYAKEATYDRRRAQVNLAAPAIITHNTAGEEMWRATAGQGIAAVPRKTDLFPSSLGDITMSSNVVIIDAVHSYVLTSSGVVSYLAGNEILFSTDRSWVRRERSVALFPHGFLMETRGTTRVRQGRPGLDLLGEYRKREQSRPDVRAKTRGE